MVHIRGTPENMHSLSVEYFAPTFSFNQFPTIIEWPHKEPILSLLHCTAIQFYIADISYCRYCIESIKFQQVPAIGFEAASICPWVFALLNGECFFSQWCEWTKWGDAGSNLGSKRETDEVLKVDIWFSTQSWNWKKGTEELLGRIEAWKVQTYIRPLKNTWKSSLSSTVPAQTSQLYGIGSCEEGKILPLFNEILVNCMLCWVERIANDR